VAVTGEGRKRVAVGERGEIAPVEACAVREIRNAREWPLAACFDDAFRTRFGQPADEAQAEAQCGVRSVSIREN
jgi:hypothetical protein